MISSQASDLRARFALPVLRLAPRSRLEIVLASRRPFFFGTHWLSRSYICPQVDCPACAQNVARNRGFFLGECIFDGVIKSVLIELSPMAVGRMEDQLRLEGVDGLTSTKWSAFRNASNQPTHMHYEGKGSLVDASITTDHRLLAAIAVLFGLPLPHRSDSVEDYGVAAMPVARQVLTGALAR